MIIDGHSHMVSETAFDRVEAMGGSWAQEMVRRWKAQVQWKPHAAHVTPRVEQLDRNGIDLQVVTILPSGDCNLIPADEATQLAYARLLNDGMAQLTQESGGKLLATLCVPMASIERGGRQEVERAVNELGLKGLFIPTNVRGKPIDAPEFEAFWALASEMDLPVYLHPVDPFSTEGRPYEADYGLQHNLGWPFETALMLSRLVFSGLMERYPNLKVVNHHLGGGLIPFFMGRTGESYANDAAATALPQPLFHYFSKFFYDTAVGGSSAAVRCAYDVFGADQLLFASDAPYGPGTGEFRLVDYPAAIGALGMPAEDEQKIMGDNAAKLLKLTGVA